MFGLYATTGKAAAPLAPALFTLFTVLPSTCRYRHRAERERDARADRAVTTGGRSRSPNMFSG